MARNVSPITFGTNAFLAECGGISTTLSRKLERLGIIHPVRARGLNGRAGHRVFSARDVKMAQRWLQERDKCRPITSGEE